ncbi:hypothetical protein CRM22_010511 [Opisthorchis felineus]|uniref:Uncharacterized protein n=1 Tax=Opisthorchis felineus TaxID=147828 RepID=A0A4S2KXU9_OPIFE|nr:hypothetical protein CRM22_010511 [Opisthorchis felineus]
MMSEELRRVPYIVPCNGLEADNLSKQPVNIKCVLLGDSGVGKTSLVVSYTTNDYPSKHTPSAFDTFFVEVCVDNRLVHLQICDAGGGGRGRGFDFALVTYPDQSSKILSSHDLSAPDEASVQLHNHSSVSSETIPPS